MTLIDHENLTPHMIPARLNPKTSRVIIRFLKSLRVHQISIAIEFRPEAINSSKLCSDNGFERYLDRTFPAGKPDPRWLVQ